MDPLSMTASIIAVLQLTTSLTSYLNDVRHATSEQKRLAIEATSLLSLLTSLRYRVEDAQTDDEWFNQVKLLGIPNGPLEQLQHMLEHMVERTGLTTTKKRDQALAALKWSFTKSGVDSSLNQIERLKSLVSIALSNDAFKLSQKIHDSVTNLGAVTRQVQHGVEQLRIQAEGVARQDLTRWLAVPDPSTNYRNALKKRHPGTGSWLLASQQFQTWKASKSSLLWLHGKAGCGKTVLSATALNDVLQTDTTSQPTDAVVAYFYFDFNDREKQSSEKAIRSLLLQYAVQIHGGLQALQQLYHSCKDGTQQPEGDQVRSLLYTMIEKVDQKQKYIVLDALDECQDRGDLCNIIEELMVASQQGFCVLTTSRLERDIELSLRPIVNHAINIQSAVVDLDIDAYVRNRLETDRRLRKWPNSVKDEIATELFTKADGMFRWADCQIESLSRCVQLRDLRRALSTLPRTLDETYARILNNIEAENHLQNATTVLQWLCFAGRPLCLSELVEILAIQSEEDGDGRFDPDERLPEPGDITTICSSLISYYTLAKASDDETEFEYDNAGASQDKMENNRVEPGSMEDEPVLPAHEIWIRLAHFSVQEYLLSDRCPLQSYFNATTCHVAISESCLYYLTYISQAQDFDPKDLTAYPLAQYAAYWGDHAQAAGEIPLARTTDLICKFLTNEHALFAWNLICNFDMDRDFVDLDEFGEFGSPFSNSPLYYSAQLGLVEVTKRFIASQIDVNIEGGGFGTALIAASVAGHGEIAQILINAGADTSKSAPTKGTTALMAASGRGYENIVQMLVDAGADLNRRGQPSERLSALLTACLYGHEKIVQILINAGADVNALSVGSDSVSTALNIAALDGNERIVQMLVDAGAEINTSWDDRGFSSTVPAAPPGDHVGTTQMFIDARADTHTPCPSAIMLAAAQGYKKIVQILIDNGADVNVQSTDGMIGFYGTALQAASYYGHESMVLMLIDAGAEINMITPNTWYCSALAAASVSGHDKIVRLLIGKGADVNLHSGREYEGTAIQCAVDANHQHIVQILIDAGARFDAPRSVSPVPSPCSSDD